MNQLDVRGGCSFYWTPSLGIFICYGSGPRKGKKTLKKKKERKKRKRKRPNKIVNVGWAGGVDGLG